MTGEIRQEIGQQNNFIDTIHSNLQLASTRMLGALDHVKDLIRVAKENNYTFYMLAAIIIMTFIVFIYLFIFK